jgi:hypothetical protein
MEIRNVCTIKYILPFLHLFFVSDGLADCLFVICLLGDNDGGTSQLLQLDSSNVCPLLLCGHR